jgi:hypothetical protein
MQITSLQVFLHTETFIFISITDITMDSLQPRLKGMILKKDETQFLENRNKGFRLIDAFIQVLYNDSRYSDEEFVEETESFMRRVIEQSEVLGVASGLSDQSIIKIRLWKEIYFAQSSSDTLKSLMYAPWSVELIEFLITIDNLNGNLYYYVEVLTNVNVVCNC